MNHIPLTVALLVLFLVGPSPSVLCGTTRPARVAGAFYPANASALRKQIRNLLASAPDVEVKGRVAAALAPHAGYRYSGALAARVHKIIAKQKIDTLVIIGHDLHARGIIAVLPKASAFATPLGEVPVDVELARALCQADRRIVMDARPHSRDHTVEVHLPFLQVMGSRAKILPVLFGDPSVENCRRFVGALRRCASRRRIFLLASTDLAHYPTQADAVRLDALTMRRVTELDVKALFAHLRAATGADAAPNVKTALCASGGVGCAMVWTGARAGSSVQMLATSTSGDVPGGDASRVVGYAAALFVQNKEDKAMEDVPKQGFTVPADVQMELLALARRRIETAAKGEDFDYAPPAALKDVLSEPAAVFVTLHKDKRLRGCIGTTAAHDPLWQAVYRLAYSAAFEDHRFDRVTLAEAPQLHIEISVLSPVRRVASADEIVPGKHGVIVGSGYRRGLFLPQVWDQLPKKDEFMSILCTQKAHLSADAWKQADTEISIFTVFAFEEK